jgi:hypothetical protein
LLFMQQFPAHLKTKAMLVMEHRLGEPIEVYLERRYIRDGLTTVQIADELGVDKGTISRWMSTVGVAARLTGQRGRPAEAVA